MNTPSNDFSKPAQQKIKWHKPMMESRPMDKFFFICGANNHACGGASDVIKQAGTCMV
jgi:hypothetical protein